MLTSISAMCAANETLRLFTEFSSLKFGLDFTNFDQNIDNYSVITGLSMLAIDSVIYFSIGCFLEVCAHLVNFFLKKYDRKKLAKA